MAKLYNIKSAYPIINSAYGLDVDPIDFEDIAMWAWEEINNKHTRLYRYIGDTDNEGKLELPCNVEIIEAVTIPILDAQYTTPTHSFLDYDNIYNEHYIEHWKPRTNDFYTSGHLVDYREGDDCIYLAHPMKDVCVLYHGVLVDEEEGLPLINNKEQKAIACFVAYTHLFKEGLRKKDASSIQLANELKKDWLRLCNAARIPEHVSQNEMNAILDVKTRWDRKKWHTSFKPLM